MPTFDEILHKLTKISNAELNREHYEKYLKQALHETNDRGAALVISTNIEDVLQKAIEQQLGVVGDRKDLFGNKAPIGTFDYKIRIGEVLKIFEKETKHNLILIKAIRNAFAHAKIPIDFADPIVKEACDMLKITKMLPPIATPTVKERQLDQTLSGRKKFMRVCDITAHNLFIRMLNSPKLFDIDRIVINENEWQYVKHLDVWVMPKPLP